MDCPRMGLRRPPDRGSGVASFTVPRPGSPPRARVSPDGRRPKCRTPHLLDAGGALEKPPWNTNAAVYRMTCSPPASSRTGSRPRPSTRLAWLGVGHGAAPTHEPAESPRGIRLSRSDRFVMWPPRRGSCSPRMPGAWTTKNASPAVVRWLPPVTRRGGLGRFFWLPGRDSQRAV